MSLRVQAETAVEAPEGIIPQAQPERPEMLAMQILEEVEAEVPEPAAQPQNQAEMAALAW